MNSYPPTYRRRRLMLRLLFPICMLPGFGLFSAAQDVTAVSPHPKDYERKTYIEQNGTQTMTRTLETEHRLTSDGEVEIQRYRAPAWDGDDRIIWEREIRTKKLPDGSIEKEYILRNQDGSGAMAPVKIVHEKEIQDRNATQIHREVLDRLGGTEFQPVLKEQITKQAGEGTEQVLRVVQQLNTVAQRWETIDREVASTTTRTAGEKTQVETKAVKQTPDAWGNLTDFERRLEKTSSSSGSEIKRATVYRRDLSTSENDHFFLLDDSSTESKTDSAGIRTRHVVRQSDLLYGNWERNPHSLHPEVVEEQSTIERTAADGSKQIITKVVGRTSAQPSALRPVYTVEETSDADGYVRKINIPEW